MLTYPVIDPIIMEIGPLAIRWYSLSYLVGILLGWFYMLRLDRDAPHILSAKVREDIVLWAVAGIVLGGRVGYVLFYNGAYYLEHPLEALKIWEGGMSFHGGLLGLIFAFWLMCRQHGTNFWPLMDRAACVAPIGIFLGRIANFINGELYGRAAAADFPLAMIFPHDPAQIPRHPSQLYQAALEGLALFVLINLIFHLTNAKKHPAMLSGFFLLGYGALRFIAEFFREPDAQLGFIMGHITMGQVLCLPMMLLGLTLVAYAARRRNAD